MEPFRVHILGCGSAKPTLRHFATSQVVEIRGKLLMIDCAEGTQVQLLRYHINHNKISCVFISHLHGDHCFGLIGMICSFGMLGRTAPLHIYAPEALEDMLCRQIDLFCHGLEFEVVFHAVDTTVAQVIYDDRSLTVSTIPLEHRTPCAGFLFTEKPTLPHIRREMIDFLHVPVSQINNIKLGADWVTEEGEIIPNEKLVAPADPVRKYAYCSDTKYLPQLHTLIEGVNLLYHESTYCEDKIQNAAKYCHSTAAQAAMVARDAHARQLLLGHYSARYNNEEVLLEEARKIFPDTILSDEGMVVDIL